MFASVVLVCISIAVAFFWGENSTGVALFVGVVSSVVATSILRIFDKYCESIRAYEYLQQSAQEFCSAFDRQKKYAFFRWQKEKMVYALRQQYFHMCAQSRDILYQPDATAITGCVHSLIITFRDDEVNVKRKMDELENVLKNGTPR